MADIYAIGPLLYELVTGTLPFEAEGVSALKLKILKAHPTYPSCLTPELKNLLERLFEKDPAKRIGAKHGIREVMMHPWFKGIDWTSIEKKTSRVPFVLQVEKRKFKTLPADFNIEDPKTVAALDLLEVKEENKSEKERTRVACFSYYSPLQKAKLRQRNENREIRVARKNLQNRHEAEESERIIRANEWIGEFDVSEIDEHKEGVLCSKDKPSAFILKAQFKLMSQVKLENNDTSPNKRQMLKI